MGTSDKLTIIIIIITSVGTGITIASFFYYLRERKRVLSTVVFEKQIEACSQVLLQFTGLNQSLKDWNKQKRRIPPYTRIYPQGAIEDYNELVDNIKYYSLITPGELLEGEINLLELLKAEMHSMSDSTEPSLNLKNLDDELGQFLIQVKKYFGVENLSNSNRAILPHYEETLK